MTFKSGQLILLIFFATILFSATVSAAPSCASYDCNMFLWYPLGFIIVMGFMLYSTINILGRFVKIEVDLTDVTKSLIGFMSFLFFYYFCNTYFDDAFMLDMMGNFMYVFGFTNLLLPLIALIFTWIKRRQVD